VTRLLPEAVLGAVAVLTTATPADALSITAPGPTDLGTTQSGGTLTAQLGPVTVSSNVALATGWVATVSLSGAFTVIQAGRTATFPASRVQYWSGSATALTGLTVGLCTPGQATSLLAQTLTSPRTAYTCPAIVALSSSLTWRPTLVVTTQGSDPVGTYSGTITHSVA
jgi:hypothetical protein